jgi:hypothetical protein
MTWKRISIELLVVSLSLGAFTTSCKQPLSASDKKQITTDIEQMMTNYCRDVKANGLTAEFSYLDSSADFYWIPPGYEAPLSYDSIAAILVKNAPLLSIIDNHYQQLHITPLSYEKAIYAAQVISSTTDTAGRSHTVKLLEAGTLIKRKDGWKLLYGHTTMVQ